MRFYSPQTRNVSLKEALFQGFAPEGELYVPQDLPYFTLEELKRFRGLSFLEVSFEVGKKLFPEVDNLRQHLAAAFDFPVPFVSFSDNMFLLELFHGPTLSFKDFGARMLAQLTRALKKPGEELTVLVATSGDTGSAVGHAFCDRVERVERRFVVAHMLGLPPHGHFPFKPEPFEILIDRGFVFGAAT